MDHEERYDEQLERFYDKQERAEKKAVLEVSQFDGMIHTADGKEFDPNTGREVDIDQNPNLSGSYIKGPEVQNSWANGNAPEGTRIHDKNVTGYIVPIPKVLPEENRSPGTFGAMDDIQNNHYTGDSREAARQAQIPEEAYYEGDRYPYTSWRGANNSGD